MMKLCTLCNGSKKSKYFDRPCYACEGTGCFLPPDEKAILAAITSSRGTHKGRLLKSRPDRKHGARAYYVWRMARFHGGADVCMPVMAQLSGDPYTAELDSLVDRVAAANFGTAMAAAYRWGSALGMVDHVPAGLPESAYPGHMPGTAIGGPDDSPEYHAEESRVPYGWHEV